MTEQPADTVLLGRLGRTVGLEGGQLFHAAGPVEADLLEVGLSVWVAGLGMTVIRDLRSHSRGSVLFLRGVRRLEAAKALVNSDMLLDRSRLPADFDLLSLADGASGLPVLLVQDGELPRELGTVLSVTGNRGHELLVVAPASGGASFMLPLHAPYVTLANDSVRVEDPPAGLLPEP